VTPSTPRDHRVDEPARPSIEDRTETVLQLLNINDARRKNIQRDLQLWKNQILSDQELESVLDGVVKDYRAGYISTGPFTDVQVTKEQRRELP
jgi:hypothetical protein